MLLEHLFNKRLFNDPAQAQTPGHRLLLRGGYIHQLSPGIYGLSPLGHRVLQRLQAIVREEMNGVEGQEISLPRVAPASLWKQAGRMNGLSGETVQFEDHSQQPHVLPTSYGEAVVEMARSYLNSYRQLPLLTYHLGPQFQDSEGSRGGLLKTREAIVKEGFSFHRTQEELEQHLDKIHSVYHRLFQRCGLLNVVSLSSGEEGIEGDAQHEFMLLNEAGDELLLTCEESGYQATQQTATSQYEFGSEEQWQPLRTVMTPGVKTIDALADFLNTTPEHTCKSVAFVEDSGEVVVAFVRGDFNVNPHKVKRVLGSSSLRVATDRELKDKGLFPGYIGPVGLEKKDVRCLFDPSVAKTPNLVIGANSRSKHRTGFTFERDIKNGEVHDLLEVREGDPCPISGNPLQAVRGIRLGVIAQLGSRVTRAMNHTYNEEDGGKRHPLMVSYRLDLTRLLAGIVEENHDDYGPRWPIALAPWRVHICCLQAKDEEVRLCAHELYRSLKHRGIEAILDTRKARAGVMFGDADLIGAPIRAILSPRNLKKGIVELKYRLSMEEEKDNLPTEMPVFHLVEEADVLFDELRSVSAEFDELMSVTVSNDFF